MEDKKEYSNEMRGSLWKEKERKEKGPIMTGNITISGVKLRVAMWDKRKAPSGDEFWGLSVEYPQGATKFLVAVKPTDVTATGSVQAPAAETAGDTKVDDMPF